MRTGTAYPEAQIKVSAPFEDRPKYKSVDISHSISMASVLNIENLLRFKFCFGSNVSLVDSRSKIRSATEPSSGTVHLLGCRSHYVSILAFGSQAGVVHESFVVAV